MRVAETTLNLLVSITLTSGFTPPAQGGALTAEPAAEASAAAFLTQARPAGYTVRPGDTLTSIAARICGRAIDWTGLYHANRGVIGWNPDQIRPRQELTIACYDPPVTTSARIQPRTRDRDGDYDRDTAPARYHRTAPSATYHGSTAMQQCIIARESGGHAQTMNSTGHYGLYQFSYQTWVAHGGNPADFGHASITEQNRVFWNTVAADGYRDWTPYDGC